MKNPKAIALTAITLSVTLLAAATKPEEAAQKAAEEWLALVDAGKFADSWKTSAASFRAAVPQAQWKSSLGSVRKPLGPIVSRKLKSAKYTKSLPGAPEGEYVILQFETAFVDKKAAVETVTPMLDSNGEWRVSGYYIK